MRLSVREVENIVCSQMINYISLDIDIDPYSEDASDLMASFLADIGYESFTELERDGKVTGLTAYIRSDAYNETAVEEILRDFPMDVKIVTKSDEVESRDWNEEWEKNYFQPITIEGRCVIHSTFHKDVPSAEYDIVIDPKMAFGTGHHATTCMMLEYLLELDLKGKRVIDMGAGTGILSILSAMRGASSVDGVEIDPGACENARENVALNGADAERRVCIHNGDSSTLLSLEPADVFIANINRNIILADMNRYASALKPGGIMLLSGFYVKDNLMITDAGRRYGLKEIGSKRVVREDGDEWQAVMLTK